MKKLTITNKPSFIFASITLLLCIPSVLILWLVVTFTNTNNFINAVAPVAKNQNVQKYASETVTNSIVNNVNVDDLTTTLIGSTPFKIINPQWIKVMIQPVVQNGVNQIISSNQFYEVLVRSLTLVHKTTMHELNIHSSGLILNFHPLVVSTVAELNKMGLGKITDSLNVSQNTGIIKFDNSRLDKLRHNYQQTILIAKVIIILPIITLIVAVYLSRTRLKTFSNIYLYSSVLLFILLLAVLCIPSFVSTSNPDQAAAIRASITIITHSLVVNTAILAVLLLTIGALIKKYETQVDALFSNLVSKIRKNK